MPTPTQMLAQIAAWLPALDAAAHAATGLHSPRPTSGGHSGNGAGLPHHLAAILDTTDDGPAGIRTSAGVLDILHPWALQLADERGEPAPARRSTLPYLIGTIDWAQGHAADWEALAETITDTWHILARATGHTPATIGTCPNCGGTITTDPTPHGIPEHGSCEQCDRWYQDKEDQAMTRKVALNQVLRNTKNPAIYVGWGTLSKAFPTLSHDRLRQWAHRGHVHTQPGPLYQVTAVHARLDREQDGAA
jgi:hypothetical protein